MTLKAPTVHLKAPSGNLGPGTFIQGAISLAVLGVALSLFD